MKSLDGQLARHSAWQTRVSKALEEIAREPPERREAPLATLRDQADIAAPRELFQEAARSDLGLARLRARLISPAWDRFVDSLPPAIQGPRTFAAHAAASGARNDPLADAQLEPLGRGRRFDPLSERRLDPIAGVRLTRDGLASAYRAVLPEASVVISKLNTDPRRRAFEYTVSWLDGDANVVATIGRILHRDEDDSLELHAHSVWLAPSVRGENIPGRLAELEADLLRTLSLHPRTRLTLGAGSMSDPNRPDSGNETIGFYAWAARGYDFADAHGAVSKLLDYGARTKDDDRTRPDVELQRDHFRRWIDARVADGSLKVSAALHASLSGAVDAIVHPWDLASFRVSGLLVSVTNGGRTSRLDLGKAYLLSGEAPYWNAVSFVNSPSPEGSLVARAYDWTSDQAVADRRRARQAKRGAELAQPFRSASGRDEAILDQLRALALSREEQPARRYDAAEQSLALAPEPDLALVSPLIRDESLPLWMRANVFSAFARGSLETRPADVAPEARWVVEHVEPGDDAARAMRDWADWALSEAEARAQA